MTTMYSATSPHFLHMIWKIGDFLLDDRVKLFYTVSAYQLNYIYIFLIHKDFVYSFLLREW
jgi:hypothetical protein